MKSTDVIFKAAGKVPPVELIFISADSTLQEAAALMRDRKCSVLRVGRKDKMVGIVSAYDIITNAVAHNRTAAKIKVREVMVVGLPPLNPPGSETFPAKATKSTPAKHLRKPGRLAFNAGVIG